MKHKKRNGVAAVALALSVLMTGCGSAADEPVQAVSFPPIGDNPVSDEPVTFSMMYSGQFNPNYKCLKKMEELTNVTLKVTEIPDADFDTRAQLVINTGEELPDIICKTTPTIAQALSGVLLPISDYFDQMPNYMQFIRKHDLQYLIDDAMQSDGKVYQLPAKVQTRQSAEKQIMIREDIFKKHDIPIPTTYDELYEAAKRLKQIYPDTYPITVIYGNGNLLDMVAPSFGFFAGWSKGIDNFHYVKERDDWIFAPTSDEYKVMLEYLNKLYSEKLLHQEYATLSLDQYQQEISTNKTFIIMADWLGCDSDYNKALNEGGFTDAKVVPIYPLEGPKGTFLPPINHALQTMVISAQVAKKDYFPQFIRWIDWMYSPEGIDLWSWGIEGDSYTIDSNGTKQLSPEMKSISNPDGINMREVYGTNNNNLTFAYPDDLDTMHPDHKALIEKEIASGTIPIRDPRIPLTEEDVEVQALYSTNLNDYVDQMTTKFIMGTESFGNWDKFVSECETKGADQLLKLYNEAWDRHQEMKKAS